MSNRQIEFLSYCHQTAARVALVTIVTLPIKTAPWKVD